MREIEIKAKIDNVENVLLWLSNHATFNRDVFQEDILYDFLSRHFVNKKTLKADEFMRIRRTKQNDLLTHKIIRRDPKGNFLYCDEHETIITKENVPEINHILKGFGIKNITKADCQDGMVLHALLITNGFKELIKITKNRKEYTLNEFNIALDEVVHLGRFIEIESLSDEVAVERVKSKAKELLNDINIPAQNIVEKGYFDLLMAKNFG